MKKKLVSFGMAAMMAASLAACGGSKPAETTAAADKLRPLQQRVQRLRQQQKAAH